MGRLVPAVTRALDILELFLDGDGTLSAPDIVRKLQLPTGNQRRVGLVKTSDDEARTTILVRN